MNNESSIEHVHLSDEDACTVWPWAVVRGTGFPAAWILELAAPEAARAADRWLDARHRLAEVKQATIEHLWRAQDTEGWTKAQLRRALRKVKQNAMPRLAPDAGPWLDEWRGALADLARAREQFAKTFERGRTRARERLRALAREPRLREAVAWQNPPATRHMLDKLAATPLQQDTTRTRYTELNVAHYVQRYCVKNDTIGFFGPVCWARITGEGAGLAHTPGELMASSEVFYEDWAIAELCKVLDSRALRPWLRPRRLPAVGLVGREAYLLMPEPMVLGDIEARVLAMCDGTRSARAIAAEVLQRGGGALATEADVFAILDGLCERGLAVWRVETMMSMRPQELLRDLLNDIDDEALRAGALAPLDRLESARRAVARARGADALIAAVEALERTYRDITGQPVTRNPGRTYAARRLIYLDGRRGDDIAIGPAVLDRLAPVLAMLSRAARWFTSQTARAYREALEAVYEQVAGQMQTHEVPLLRLWMAAQPLFPLEEDGSRVPAPLAAVLERMRDLWQEVLELPEEPVERAAYASEDLLPRVREIFGAEAPGWAHARHHGPDIMLAATDADAIERGDFQIVLGEFHCAINTSIASCLLTQHPRVEDMRRLWDADLPEPCIIPGVPRQIFPVRVNRELATEKDYRLEWAPDIAGPPQARRLAAGDLVAVREDGQVIVRSRDGALRLDLIEFFGLPLSTVVASYFPIPSGRGYTPRITIDDVVVTRRKWTFTPAEHSFWSAKTPAERFLQVRAWAREQGMPRFCFARTPVELKPIYVDFDSPIYTDVFARLCKNTASADATHRMSISEMLPTPDQLWLADRDDNRYTSEIRLVAVDGGSAGSR